MKRYTLEEVKRYFKEHGCELLAKEYKNCNTLMPYICGCKNRSNITFSSFKQGHRCEKCLRVKLRNKFALSYEYVYNYFKEHGCKMLDDFYINARTLINYECECRRKSKITFDSFRRGNRCRECGNEKSAEKQKHTYEYVYNYFKKYGYELLEKKYINSHIKMQYRCPCGHISYMSFNNFQQGKRCKICSIKNRSGKNHYEWIEDREEVERVRRIRDKCHKMLKHLFKRTGQIKNEKTYKILGYNFKELKEYIYTHPNWKNVKDKDWHLDHYFPIKAFLDYGIKDIKLINCLENLQPLLAIENMRKNAKYDAEKFEGWLKTKGYEIYEVDE